MRRAALGLQRRKLVTHECGRRTYGQGSKPKMNRRLATYQPTPPSPAPVTPICGIDLLPVAAE
jgi:hypothetical protein